MGDDRRAPLPHAAAADGFGTGAPLPARVHLIGIGGAHMSAIARILMAGGVHVSGSDTRDTEITKRLAELGAVIHLGHDAANLGDAALVVFTAAVNEDNAEVREARRRGVPVISRARMVARLMEGRVGVAVAGTAGKTTTSALLAFMLVRAGRSPSYLLGGESVDLGGNAAPGDGPDIVVEADEYARAFLEYRPRIAVVTNVEPDHLEYFGSVDEYISAFRQFLGRVPHGGTVIGCADSPMLASLMAEPLAATVQRYRVAGVAGPDRHGAGAVGTDWMAVDGGPNDLAGHTFTLLRSGEMYGQFDTAQPGLHNVANATGAIAAGAALGLTPAEMRDSVRAFRGTRRRFEKIGEARGILVIDDYAHHPSKVRATLAAARERFPDRRVVVLFQPHTYSRTAYLRDEFRDCFVNADALYILETYAARETPDAGMSAEALAGEIRAPAARYVASIRDAAELLAIELQSGDVLFTMGAGDVTEAAPAVLAALRGRDGTG